MLLTACAADERRGTTAPASSLVTRWADEVTPDAILSEYPRPQMVRPYWVNLNGYWDYAIRDSSAGAPQTYDGRILVPFAVESQLSGVAEPVSPEQRLWYRRTFEVSDSLPGARWLLHFGAVDWQAEIFVNGDLVGEHRGGFDPFSFDITDRLRQAPHQELTVIVWDPTDEGDQPRGKQVLDPHGIWYTAVTGIWQTAWLEPVPTPHITSLRITPDVDASAVILEVAASGQAEEERITATAFADGIAVAAGRGRVGGPLTLPIPDPRLWSPGDPFLYELTVKLVSGDSVRSYFGMRKIAVQTAADGHQRLFLNNEPLFHFGPLDQGWWPDGLYTAPTDEALSYDVALTKRLGFNMARKHVKAEPDRWYYHCDRLGLMVWQDMPSGNNNSEAGKQNFARELELVVDALRNHPSIVMWVPFNEGWGQHETERYVDWLVHNDPTRLVNNASGWADRGVGDVLDIHRYPGPGIPIPDGRRAAVLGEFGGLGLPLDGHLWVDRDNWGYRAYETREALGRAYSDLMHQLRPLIGEGLAAAVYTQTSDVEIEVNGLVTYDRAVEKLPQEVLALNQLVYGDPPVLRAVVPTSRTVGQTWRYTTNEPDAEWFSPDFDDSAWQEGQGGFGSEETPGAVVRTAWETTGLWLRRSFQLESLELTNPNFRIHHDEDAEVYINGQLIGSFSGYTVDYTFVPLDERALAALHRGRNTIAVHVRQTDGGQYFDVGIVEVVER